MNADETFRKIILDSGTIKTYTCIIGTSRDNGQTLEKSITWDCHASLRNVPKGSTDLYSSLFVATEALKPEAEQFWSFILDPNISPFKSVLQGVTIIRGLDNYPIAFRIKADGLAQVIGSLCIATRIPEEHSNVLRSWYLWREHGFDNHEAMVLANMILIHTATPWFHQDNGHYPFNTNLSIDRLRNGPKGMDFGPLNAGGSYSPNNFLWSDGNRYNNTQHPLAAKCRAVGEYQGVFNNYRRNYQGNIPRCLPLPELVKLFKENRGSI